MLPAEDDHLARRVGELLAAKSARVATLETTAGGLLSTRLISVPGASVWFDRGAVAYSRAAKLDFTGVSSDALERHGTVSSAAVALLAEGFRAASGVDFALAESGIAGPQTGRRSAKPAGTVAIAIAGPAGTVTQEEFLPGTRAEVMHHTAERCLLALIELLEREIH